MSALTEGLGPPTPQVGEVTYAKKIQPEELHLDLDAPAALVDRVIRLGRAWTTHNGARLRIWEASVLPGRNDLAPGEIAVDKTSILLGCGRDALELATVQPEGRARMSARAWVNGNRLESGVLLGR